MFRTCHFPIVRCFSWLHRLVTARAKWWFLFLISWVIVSICHGSIPKVVQSMPIPNALNALNDKIHQLRMGDFEVKVVGPDQQPIPGATVHLEQLTHHFEFGTALETEIFNAPTDAPERINYLALAQRLFNASVHENALKWHATEPIQNQISYADADRILAWSEENGLKMRGHTLFWEAEIWNQDWLKALNRQALQQAAQKRALEVCTRYRGRLSEYDVLNETLHDDFFRSRLGEDIIDQMFQWCHQADPDAQLYVNDFDILNGKDLNQYVAQIRALLDRGVPVHGIGIQGHIQEKISAAQIQHTLDTLAQFELPIKITEFDVQADTEAEQARVLETVYRIAFAHPAVTGIYMWGFWQNAHWQPEAALFRADFTPKPAAEAYQALIYDQWWTDTEGRTNDAGEFQSRAFWGEYQVTVKVGNSTSTQRLMLSPESSPRQILIRSATTLSS
ncbi:MAG: endo-1,4-beta-xylanase [Cyanothece sp. SIO1E1]|nr:endo-1,4-beta-xylanase [Cyanothece sp. SIO1E1]